MKKVIEHGYRYNMETICPNCGCRFSYEWEDVETRYNSKSTYYTYAMYPIYLVSCPECMHYFEILNWSFVYPDKKENTTITWTCNSATDTCKCKDDCDGCKCKEED